MADNFGNIEIKQLSVYRENKKVIDNISFSPEPRSFTALVGKNGCGKSTVVSCINSMLKYEGEITYGGKKLSAFKKNNRAKFLSVLPQILPRPHITVFDLALLGRNPYIGIGKRPTEHDVNAAKLALENIGIYSIADKYLDEISGGECQKAYLAMIVCQDTEILVLDEPTTYMDISCADEFLSLLCSLKNKTVLTIMHDLNLAVKYADRIAVLDNGKLIFHGETQKAMSCGIIESVFGVKKYTCGNRTFYGS